ncbi:MAG: putative quinol monooxygenase [Terriglobales bacterium]
MPVFSLLRFHALPACENAAEQALRSVLAATREEAGCLAIHAFRSIRDPGFFYIHSQWKDEAALEVHARLPHTVHFIESMEPLIDHPFEFTRSERID